LVDGMYLKHGLRIVHLQHDQRGASQVQTVSNDVGFSYGLVGVPVIFSSVGTFPELGSLLIVYANSFFLHYDMSNIINL
jgi:hypothetical protein